MAFSAEQLRGYEQIMRDAFASVMGRPGSPWEIQAAAAVGWYESGFGTGWKDGGCQQSRNWGAITSAKPTCCYTTDHKPDGTAYKAYFECYDTDLDAAAGIVRWIKGHAPGAFAAAASGDLGAFSTLLWQAHYYTGICAPYAAGSEDCRRSVIRAHAQGLHRLARQLAAAAGEPAIPLGTLPDEPSGGIGRASASSIGAFAMVGVASLAILALTVRKR